MLSTVLKNVRVWQLKAILIVFLLVFATGGILLFWQIQGLAVQIPLTDIKEQHLFLSRIGLLFIALAILVIGILLVFLETGAWRDGFYDGFKNGYHKGITDGSKKV